VTAAGFLNRLNHNVAFIGDIGVGKSTAISFIFELLVPASLVEKAIIRPILETAQGALPFARFILRVGPSLAFLYCRCQRVTFAILLPISALPSGQWS
jgi:hypothetical protein